MKDDHDLDETLRKQFGTLRQQDALHAPAFASMLERARSAAPASDAVAGVVVSPRTKQRWRPARLLAWGTPLLVAAGLAAVFVRVQGAGDREFEQSVSAWSRMSNAGSQSPTDRLLLLPGSEYLRSTPVVGTSRPRSPS